MKFHDVRFPSDLSFGSQGGPERRTEIVRLVNGFEERNSPWADSLRRYDAGLGIRSLDDIAELLAFFEARQGQLYGFRWKDWADHRSARFGVGLSPFDQELGTGDGARREFRLRKRYASGDAAYWRPIAKPVPGSVAVAVAGVVLNEGSGLEIDTATGRVTFIEPPRAGEAVTAGFEFDVPVRFDTDSIVTSIDAFQAGEVPSIPVVEIRL